MKPHNVTHGGGEKVGAGRRVLLVVLGDQPAEGNAGKFIEQRQHTLPDGSTDIFKIDVDSVRAGCRELVGEFGCPVIDGRVEAQIFEHITAFLGSARNSDGPCSSHPGELPNERAYRTAGGSNDDSFSGFWSADHGKTPIGGESRHPEYAERSGDWRQSRIDLANAGAIGDRMRTPACLCRDDISGRISWLIGGDDLSDGFSWHGHADTGRSGIGSGRTHAAAHIGVQGWIEDTHKETAWRYRGHWDCLDAEVLSLRRPPGP